LRTIPSGALSRENATTIIQKIGAAGIFGLTITGGEPLLNYSVTLASLTLARSLDMAVSLNSNLVLLTPDKAAGLRQAGLANVLTSILGPTPEIHDSITQRKHSFDKLIAGIVAAQGADISVSANMVVSRHNYRYVRETAAVVAGLGIKKFMATKAGCPGNCSDFSELALSRSQFVKVLNDLCWVHETLGLKVDTLEPIPFCGMNEVGRPELFASRRCHAGVTTAAVSYDGSVRPCPHLDVSYGNLLGEDLSTIWTRMDPWCQGVHVPPECSQCAIFRICGGGCRMEGKTSTGRLDGLDPFTSIDHSAEMTERIRLFQKPFERVAVRRFKTPRFRLRRESFGGVLASGNTHVFLDEKGFGVVSQLKPGAVYDLAGTDIDWNGLSPEKFVSGLLHRNAVSAITD
jgi:radical SAM protein with 4Fe4S-binding SPASM domain